MQNFLQPVASLMGGGPRPYLQSTMVPSIMSRSDRPGAMLPNPGGVGAIGGLAVPLRGNPLTILGGDPRSPVDRLLGPAGSAFQRSGVGQLTELPASEQETNPAMRISRVIFGYQQPKTRAERSAEGITFEPPGQFDIGLAFASSRITSGLMPTLDFDATRIANFPGAAQPIESSSSLMRQRAANYSPPSVAFASRTMMRTITQYNYTMALQDTIAYNEAVAAGDAAVQRFLHERPFQLTPAVLFHMLNHVAGVVFESEPVGDVFPILPGMSEDSRTRAATLIMEGQSHMFNYTRGVGVVNGAIVCLVVRRAPVTRDTVFVHAAHGKPRHEHQTFALDALPFGVTVSPVQIAVLCFPGGMPPPEYRNYKYQVVTPGDAAKSVALSLNDGLIIPVGRVLHKSAGRVHGHFHYEDPPLPEDLKPLHDMSKVANEPLIEMLLKPSRFS